MWSEAAQSEKLTLLVADNNAGYFGVNLKRGRPKPYLAQVRRVGKLVYLGSFATAEQAALCVARLRESSLQLAAQYIRAVPPPVWRSLPVPPTASTRARPADPPQGARRKRPRSEEEEEEPEALAVRVAGAPPALRAAGSASSSNGNEDGLADEGTEQEAVQCGGCCFAGLATFAGEPSDRPDPGAPEGGWGHTLCCGKPVHFVCLGMHLNPTDKLVDSTSGPVQMELGCPFCRKPLSRASSRQLHAEGRCMRSIHIYTRLEHLALLPPTHTAIEVV